LLIVTTVLNVGRIYRRPSLGMFGAVMIYILLELLAGSRSRGTEQ
jgi:hypothetical protein